MPLPEAVKDFSDEAILELLVDAVPDRLPPWNQSWDTIAKYLALEWPTWFREIVERQTRSYKRTNREAWWHMSPNSVDERELKRVVRDKPYLALKLFKSRLEQKQLLSCIENSITGAIEFSFDDMTDDQVIYAANNEPGLLLIHAANKLDQNVFEFCVHQAIEIALAYRETMTASNRAMVLSLAVFQGVINFDNPVNGSIMEEIRNSLIANHEMWNRTYEGDYYRLYCELVSEGIFDFFIDGESFYEGIRSVLPDSEKLGFDLFIADQI